MRFRLALDPAVAWQLPHRLAIERSHPAIALPRAGQLSRNALRPRNPRQPASQGGRTANCLREKFGPTEQVPFRCRAIDPRATAPQPDLGALLFRRAWIPIAA